MLNISNIFSGLDRSNDIYILKNYNINEGETYFYEFLMALYFCKKN